MQLKKSIERVPGGMMIVPLVCGAALTTFAPHAAPFFGSFTNALCNGALPILAVFYVCMGARISVATLPQLLKKGGALLGTKIALGFLAALVLGHLIGVEPIRSGFFAGLSTLAVVAAINDTNGGLYMALMQQYGRPEESAAYSVMSLESGPFLTMISLGVAGLSGFPWQTLVGAVLPLAVGMLLGNLDREMRDFLANAVPVIIPFFAFALGCTLDLHQILHAGLLGIGLGLVIVTVSAIALIAVDRLVGGDGTAGVAAASTAGNAAAVPALVGIVNPSYAPSAASATVLVAACVVVSSLLVPPFTALWKSRARRNAEGKPNPNPRAEIDAKTSHSR
jgi:2-keto-3-deoxygluconate permease